MNEPTPSRNPLRRLYDWTLSWADTPYGLPALVVISFVEASIFPIPPDVLLMPLCFARPERWVRYALWCTVGSVFGGILGWCIGAFLWSYVSAWFFHYVPGFSPERFQHMEHWFQQYGFWIVLVKGLTPIPFKIVTIAAGVFQVNLWQLIVAAIISRAGRFFIVAGLIRAFGQRIRPFLEKHLDLALLIFFIVGLLGFVVLKWVH
jgi:membrane protein YqaA with SNARE-associated domain